MRWLVWFLAGLLVLLQYKLWVGDGSLALFSLGMALGVGQCANPNGSIGIARALTAMLAYDIPLMVAIAGLVISTGSTLQGMRVLMDKIGAEVVVQAAVFTEGDRAKWTDIIALGHLPVFIDTSAGMPD